MKASLSSLSKIGDLKSCGSFLLDLKEEAENCCAAGNSLYEIQANFQADSADKEADDCECEICYEEFSEVNRQAVLMCNKTKVCRACILQQIGNDLKQRKNLNCVACRKPYLRSRAKLLMGKCCILCFYKQDAEVSCSQFVEGPVDSFANSCGHRFCRKCIKDYLVKSWKSGVARIKCPGFYCSSAIDFNTQKKFLSQEIAKKKCTKLLSAFQEYCARTLSSQLNPWIWISPCCQKNIELPLQWVIRSWCPSIDSEVSEEVLKCTSCATIWYGILFICINSF